MWFCKFNGVYLLHLFFSIDATDINGTLCKYIIESDAEAGFNRCWQLCYGGFLWLSTPLPVFNKNSDSEWRSCAMTALTMVYLMEESKSEFNFSNYWHIVSMHDLIWESMIMCTCIIMSPLFHCFCTFCPSVCHIKSHEHSSSYTTYHIVLNLHTMLHCHL